MMGFVFVVYSPMTRAQDSNNVMDFEQDPYLSLIDSLCIQSVSPSSINDQHVFISSAMPIRKYTTGINIVCNPNNSLIQTTYYNGLGLEQEIAVRDGAFNKSVVTYKTYDPQGNICSIWTPVPCSNINTFVPLADIEAAYATFFDNESNYQEQYTYDNVALGRICKIKKTGKDWQNNEGVKTEYLSNRHSSSRYFFNTQLLNDGSLSDPVLMSPNQIILKQTKDEDGRKLYEYYDKSGRLVLSRTIEDSVARFKNVADTYYVYDGRDNIRYVLPPEASYRFFKSSEEWDDLCYKFEYDIRGNLCSKKLPGCEPIYYVYDRNNLLVYSQDGNQRSQGKWTHNAYDTFGRLAYTAVVSDNRTMEQLQESLMHTSPRVTFNETNGTIFGYTASTENLTSSSILTVNYYDNYDFISNFANDSLAYRNMTGYDSKYTGLIASQSAKGYLTGMATRVLGDTTMLVKSLYYDCHGNVIQSHESNAVGGYEHDYMHLTFTGKPLTVRHEHSTDSTHHVDVNTMTYDAMERPLTTTVTHDGTLVDVITNTYDDLGRLASQSCLNNRQTTSYSYNIRNWITGIDAGELIMKQSLHYADAVDGSTPCYNGNISAMDWNLEINNFDMKLNRYCYNYDGMNRLTGAAYTMYYPIIGMGFNNQENFSTSYSYDLNSNITALRRYGRSGQYGVGSSRYYDYGLIDNIAITRDGNQLKKVTDYCDELTYAGAMDFKDGANEHVEYTWDANGNMTSDLNKGLTEIQYNVLNLPEKITHSDGHITYITYAADGRKLRVTYKIDPTATIEPGEPFLPHGSISPLGQQIMANGLDRGDIQHPIDDPIAMDVIMTRDYCGAYTYRNGTIERIMMGSGFIQDSVYYVQIKDYQGNVRAVLDQNHNLIERNEYYPYGGLINASDSQLQPYKYSSKELDRENGLDLYDSQARWFDPMLPQTTTQDPLAEKYFSISPYTWCAGNPVRFVDPDGERIYMLFYTTGNEGDADKMFKAAAETRQRDIESSKNFDSKNDIVVLNSISDLGELGTIVNNIVDTYSKKYGKTAEFGIWSHSALDGPVGTKPTSHDAKQNKQMTIRGWASINFNWMSNASAYFYGCQSGEKPENKTSFTTNLSGCNNFRNVNVYGQTSYSYPSIYADYREVTYSMTQGEFSYPTYMVGGNKNQGIAAFFWGVSAEPLRLSRNGYGEVKKYYQPGKKHK